MQCPQCQHQNNETAKFCEECGMKLISACPQCGYQVGPTAKFCAQCGAALSGKAKGKGQKSKGKKKNRFPAPRVQSPTGERRQLTVMFCDLVGSTALSAQLDPEEYQAVVQRYQTMAATIIERYAGHVAQHLGDGILVYFGYPAAHEDDALRAVRTGLEILAALRHDVPSPDQETAGEILPGPPLPKEGPRTPPLGKGAAHSAGGFRNLEGQRALQVRIGIHTGPVVVGEIGGGEKREVLALGETPNFAARIQGQAAPQEVLISAATLRLLGGLVETEDRGLQELKGLPTPVALYRVIGESEGQSRLDAIQPGGLTPLVGREEEVALLQRRWEQVKDREGQVVLLSGEPGIGKSRLVRELRNRVEQDGAIRIEFRCSPYYQNSALHPVIEHLQRLLRWQKEDTPKTKADKLRTTLARYRFPQADTLALFTALLSLPHPADAPPLNLSPQRQKQKTEEALIAWLVEEAEQAPVYCIWEDLHWADPSTLELLGLLIEHTATARLFVLLTSRPEFTPPWGKAGHFSQLTLSRLGRRQAPQMIEKVTGGKTLPDEVVQQIVAKTDGVPLFVEELTKMVLESGLLTETPDGYKLSGPLPPLAIPSTLQDSLMARLDRLASVREIAQLGATIGREFSYELLHAVSPLDDRALQNGLRQLVEAELLYQRGAPPQATYLFKHALIQDTAYQSLLKSRRQQLHQQIAQVLEERFPDTKDMQPELLAHHYTEARLTEQAIPYWHRAGQNAVQRSANVEAVIHLTKGLEVLKALPDTPERAQQELDLQIILGPTLIATKGWAAPEVEQAYIRAQELCQRGGEISLIFPVLWGLWVFYLVREELRKAYELGEQLFTLAQRAQDPALLLETCGALGYNLYSQGEFNSARSHLEQGAALYDLQQHHALAFLYGGSDPGMFCLTLAAWTLWMLGYPDQALARMHDAFTLSQKLSHPHTLAFAQCFVAELYQLRREEWSAQEQAEAAITLSTEQGLPFWLERGIITRGWALAEQGQKEEGIAQIHQGIAAYRATGAELWRARHLALLAEAYGKAGQVIEGLAVVAEALDWVQKNEGRYYEAELYRLKGELTLQQLRIKNVKLKITEEQDPTASTQEAEACFEKAIDIARKQQAKSLELRATMSFARLWQQQGKHSEARTMLSTIYNWFTEGFDTKDLQEAKALLDEL